MLEEGEHEAWKCQHYDPKYFKDDPQGICYNRECVSADWVLDYWHPWEKVQYMDYFDKREAMKKDFVQYYEKSISKKYQPESPPPAQWTRICWCLPQAHSFLLLWTCS